ncbi:CNGC5-like protein, partial [Trifolium medium]|nr:CNGC5-like protein [Trifolium medium]
MPNNGDHIPIIDVIPSCISDEQTAMLTYPFNEEEFGKAAFSMHPDKSLCPDGLNPGFYRKFWPLIRREIFEACCMWLEEGQFPPNLNDTNIALVAKVDRLESMKDLRSISLCNVIYKILSKVLANRLKKVLPIYISDTQAAFVPGRDILDNALTAFEVLHHM